MTPAPSRRDLAALAPLVESAHAEMTGIPESAFVAYSHIGELWVVPLSEYQAMRCTAENWIRQAQAEARSRELWEKRAKAAQTIAAGFGLVLAIITAAMILRALEGLLR